MEPILSLADIEEGYGLDFYDKYVNLNFLAKGFFGGVKVADTVRISYRMIEYIEHYSKDSWGKYEYVVIQLMEKHPELTKMTLDFKFNITSRREDVDAILASIAKKVEK